MCGYMTKEDKVKWARDNLAADQASAEAWKKEQEEKTGGKIVRSTRANAGRNGQVDYMSPPKSRPGAPKPAGRDLTLCSKEEQEAHQKAMLYAHSTSSPHLSQPPLSPTPCSVAPAQRCA